MSLSATVRILSAEEIASRAGGETPFLQLPQRSTLFAERAMRLRQLASGHAMGDFLSFMADLALAQQSALEHFPTVTLPDRAALDQAGLRGVPPIPASDWPRDPAWHATLRAIVADVMPKTQSPAREVLVRLQEADAAYLERQADCLLTGVMLGLDLGSSPLVAAALQTYWVHLVQGVDRLHTAESQPFGRIDDESVCPCCGSLPTVSVTRGAGESLGQRYLVCSLCSTQWNMVRIKCSHCSSTQGLAYQALDAAEGDRTLGLDEVQAETGSRAAQAAIQAETCDACGHYLKILHTDRDAMVEPVADDLASLTLDLLVADAGLRRHGVNLMLLFGEDAPPPDPGAA